ncbi:MAG: hypothetical protein HC888_06885 [Candidatus Competibacteraceae bacterium]|nr:hypothetical protein [Candidatus Competibacteraceae bacterium]
MSEPVYIPRQVASIQASLEKADTSVQEGDLRLTNARTPTNHKSRHAIGGADPLTPSDIGAATAAHNHDGSYEEVGAADAARTAHETDFDHSLLLSALQPDDIGINPGQLLVAVEVSEDPEVVSIPGLPELDAGRLFNVPTLAYDANRVEVPATATSPGIAGQWAEGVDVDGKRYRYECVAENTWVSWEVRQTWERLEFIGPNISSIAEQVGEVISIDVSSAFTGAGRTYSLVGAPGWMSINSSGVISGTVEIGATTFIVRATIGANSVDSNPIGLTISYVDATDFSAYANGDWSESYLNSHVDAIVEIAAGGPAGSGKALRNKNNNATATLRWIERIEITAADIADADWETLALIRVSNLNGRIGIGYMDGTASASSIASFALQLADVEPKFIATGTSETGASGLTVVDPVDWVGEYIWLNKRRIGAQTQSRFWKHGEVLPAWGMARNYTPPGSPAGTAGLGWFMSHQQTDQRINEILYFACSVGGIALHIPIWTTSEFPVIEEGAHAYLNAWATKSPIATSAEARWEAFNYPLVGRGDASGDNPNTVLRKLFCMYAATGLNALTQVRSDAFKLVKETPDEYQGNQNTLFAGDRAVNALSLYTDEDELRLYPGHVAWQDGTTVVGSVDVAGTDDRTINLAPGTASRLRTNQHAFWRKQVGDFSEPETWELVYVKSVNTGANTAVVHRGWRGPLNFVGSSMRRAHASGSYICSVTTGGAATAPKTALGISGTWNQNWKWNVSSQCPLDSNNTNINHHIVLFVKRRMDEAYALLGYHADGVYQDVDRTGYNSQEGRLDCNNDGVVDYGFSSTNPATAVQWWRDGKNAQEAAIIAAIGPGTAYNCAVFMNGTENSDPILFNGTEGESGFFDISWQFNQNVQYTRFDQKFLTGLFQESRIDSGFGPRTNLDILRAYTETNPCLQGYTSQSTGDPCVYGAVGNEVARLTMTVTWCLAVFLRCLRTAVHSVSDGGMSIPVTPLMGIFARSLVLIVMQL